jgi:fagellar hook-basal body proteins
VFEEFSKVLAKRLSDYAGRTGAGIENIGYMSLYNDIAEVYTDYTQGTLENTNLKTDFAISGDDGAFFAVAVPDGEGNYRELYTRDGSFKLDDQGRLVTRDGYVVMGQNGAIFLEGDDFTVNSNGQIYQNDEYVDTLRIRKFENPETLRKYGMNLVTVSDDTVEGQFSGKVMQGFLEGSNVNSVDEMVNMITILRSYEANQKMIQYQDSTLDKAVNEIGKV